MYKVEPLSSTGALAFVGQTQLKQLNTKDDRLGRAIFRCAAAMKYDWRLLVQIA